jgi:hypothetical protein
LVASVPACAREKMCRKIDNRTVMAFSLLIYT